jgi:hypothetical protein
MENFVGPDMEASGAVVEMVHGGIPAAVALSKLKGGNAVLSGSILRFSIAALSKRVR